MALLILYMSWPMFVQSYASGEISGDAGGLVRWPVILMIPLGFALLALQGVAEIAKRIAFLLGREPERAEKKPDAA
jgi:TRAP-type mannitol/chloroaromatic compound transport system permease small subunit